MLGKSSPDTDTVIKYPHSGIHLSVKVEGNSNNHTMGSVQIHSVYVQSV